MLVKRALIKLRTGSYVSESRWADGWQRDREAEVRQTVQWLCVWLWELHSVLDTLVKSRWCGVFPSLDVSSVNVDWLLRVWCTETLNCCQTDCETAGLLVCVKSLVIVFILVPLPQSSGAAVRKTPTYISWVWDPNSVPKLTLQPAPPHAIWSSNTWIKCYFFICVSSRCFTFQVPP